MAMQIQNGVNYKKSSSNNNVNPFLKTFIESVKRKQKCPKNKYNDKDETKTETPIQTPNMAAWKTNML